MSSIEITFKIIEIIIATMGLILVIFGLIIPYQHSKKLEEVHMNNEKELERIRWKKDLIDKQISDLYGPIYAIIIESNISFSRILYQLGRNHIIPKDKGFYDLSEDEQLIWKHYVDTYKIKNQMKIIEIMEKNFHLIYKSEVPTCYKDFLDYSLGWEMLDNQKRNDIPNHYEYYYVFNYPREFDVYIEDTLKTLLNEQAKLTEASENITIKIY